METKQGPQAIAARARLEEALALDGGAPLRDRETSGTGDAQALALERGRHMHRLLELLPGLEPGLRREAALRYVGASLPEALAGHGEAIVDEAIGVLEHGDFAQVFSGKARTEVAVVGRIAAPDGSKVEVSGQIDRLCVADETVFIVDFKTDRLVPAGEDEVGEAYVTQLAVYGVLVARLYPGLAVRAALLYTGAPRLIEISQARQQAALAALSLAPAEALA